MSERISRRELTLRGLVGAAALATPGLLSAKQGPEAPKEDPKLPDRVAVNEAKLAKPLTEEARKLLKTSLSNIESAAAGRLKSPVPENSEPCFVYFAAGVEK